MTCAMNTFTARSMSGFGSGWLGMTKLWELAQAAFSVPISGSGATPHSRSGTAPKTFIIQMPFQSKAVWPFWRAMTSPSWATFLGL
jgi:hypothetical protein